MKTIEDLKNFQIKIDMEVDEICTNAVPKLVPLHDGIIPGDERTYLDSKPKMLWILKDTTDKETGGWEIRTDFIKKMEANPKFGRGPTYDPIIHSAYGILHNFSLYNEIINKITIQERINIFKTIAFINVKKTPGLRSISDPELYKGYNYFKEVLIKQIEEYEPDIIIGGRTLQCFFNDPGIKGRGGILDLENKIMYKRITEPSKPAIYSYYFNTDQLFIQAMHPSIHWSKRKILTEEIYVNNIIQIAKKWTKWKETGKPITEYMDKANSIFAPSSRLFS